MDLFTDIFQAFCVPALKSTLGDVFARFPLGNYGAQVPVTAIWNEEDAADDQERGHENKRHGWLTILDGTVPDTRDAWQINGESWQTRSWQRDPGGTITAELERHDMEVRNGAGGKLL